MGRIDSDAGGGRGSPFRTWSIAVLTLSLMVAGCSIPRWPAEGTMTSPFGLRWSGLLPVVHRGVAIAMPTGTPVRAMAPGSVRFAGAMAGYGEVVWLDHPRGTLTVYAHLDEIRVNTGAAVSHREVIGLSGATGIVSGPHLHFEVWVAGRPVDPVRYLGGFPR
ncbi:MAG: M23 family metallopeptidase [Gemmatimonadota bacterium]